jgi:hypothetical protein
MGQKKHVQVVKGRRSLNVAIAREDNANVMHVMERAKKDMLVNSCLSYWGNSYRFPLKKWGSRKPYRVGKK